MMIVHDDILLSILTVKQIYLAMIGKINVAKQAKGSTNLEES